MTTWIELGGSGYWAQLWKAEGEPEVWRKACIIQRRDNRKFYVSSRHGHYTDDIGPYDSLEHAQQVAETMYGLDALPKHWPEYETS